MRILRISHSAVVDAWRRREQLLREDGHDVLTVCARAWDEAGQQVTPRPTADEQVVPVRTFGTHPALFLYAPIPLWHLIGKEWDLIDLHEEPFSLCTAEVRLLRRLRRCRAPFTLYSAQNIDKRYPQPFRLLERAALRAAAGVQTCNQAAADICESKGFPGRAHVIPLGVDLEAFDPEPRRPPGRVVGYAGRLAEHKGVTDLFEAIEGDSTLRLRVAGDGPLVDELVGRCGQPGLSGRVEMLGALPATDLADFYRSVDVLAVPSRDTPSWREQFGRVAIEAMACGTPVVATATGSLPEIVNPAGVLVPERDPAALGYALRRVLDGTATRERCRELGLQRAEECSWQRVHEQFLGLYRASRHEPLELSAERTVHVVLVAFHRADLVDGALAAVRGLPVVVVDNSADEQVRAVATRHGAAYIDSGANIGFAGGVNIGLRRVPMTSDVLLLNPDARLSADDVRTLQERLLTEPDLASVSPSLRHPEGERERVSWPLPHPLGEWVEAAGLGARRRSQYVVGAVLLLRAEALAQVGPFDAERFFLYAEEADWAARALRLGWRHAEVQDVVALHEGAATSTDAVVREAHFHAGKERYLRKHHGAGGWHVARVAVTLGAIARAALLRGDARRASARRATMFLRGPMNVERTLSR